MVVVAVLEYLTDNPSVILVGFLLYVFIFALASLFGGKRPGRNPFSTSFVKPPQPMVIEQRLRDAVLKQRFKPSKVPEHLDAIVIGSGIGGLTTAVLLSRAGKRVLVLEQHDQAGGCCHTFHDKGFEFDTGIHYVGRMADGTESRVFTDQMTSGQVVWEPMDETYDVVALGHPEKAHRYPIKAGGENFIKALTKEFPEEEEAIKKFYKMVEESEWSFKAYMAPRVLPKWLGKVLVYTGLMYLVFPKFLKYSTCSVLDILNQLTTNEDLKAVLTYCFGDYGVSPARSSFVMHSLLINHFIPDGAFYPRGGSSEVIFHMIPTIEKHGGRVLVQAPVSKILFDKKGSAYGVRVHKTSGDIDIFAKKIISGAGLGNTFTRLLPKEVAMKSRLYPLVKKVGESTGFLTVFIGLQGSSKQLGLPASNTWSFMSSDLESSMSSFTGSTLQDAAASEVPLLYISFPSAKDSSWEERHPGTSACLVLTIVPYEWFVQWENEPVKHRGEDYEALKNRIGQQMWQQCVQLFPQLENKMEYFDVGTPLSNNYYLGTSRGEMYGLDHGRDRFVREVSLNFRADTDIPGLYVTGQDIVTCGFHGAMFGGLLTASEILNRSLYKDLIKLRKEVNSEMKKRK